MKNLNNNQRQWIKAQYNRGGINTALSNNSVLQYKASTVASGNKDDSHLLRSWIFKKCGNRAFATLTQAEVNKLDSTLKREVSQWN